MTTATAKSTSRRSNAVATSATVSEAAREAVVAEISRKLIDRVYGISQGDLAEVLEIQSRMAADKARLEMLESKVLIALQQGAEIQPGPLAAELAHANVKASVSWKGLVEANPGEAFAKNELLKAQEAVRGKRGAPYARVYKNENA